MFAGARYLTKSFFFSVKSPRAFIIRQPYQISLVLMVYSSSSAKLYRFQYIYNIHFISPYTYYCHSCVIIFFLYILMHFVTYLLHILVMPAWRLTHIWSWLACACSYFWQSHILRSGLIKLSNIHSKNYISM